MHPRRRSRFLVAFVVSWLAGYGSARATTIDFESPSIGALSYQTLSPFMSAGATFTAGCEPAFEVGLIRKQAFVGCVTSDPQNQLLISGYSAPSGESVPIRVDFSPSPASPIDAVRVTVVALIDSEATLSLYDAADVLVGSASGPTTPAPDGCSVRITLVAFASEPAVYAIVNARPPITDSDHCTISCNNCAHFAIDDFIFGDAVVAAAPTSWGHLKTIYR